MDRPPSNIELDDPCVVKEDVDELIEEIVSMCLQVGDDTPDLELREIADQMIVEATDFSEISRNTIINRAWAVWAQRA